MTEIVRGPTDADIENAVAWFNVFDDEDPADEPEKVALLWLRAWLKVRDYELAPTLRRPS